MGGVTVTIKEQVSDDGCQWLVSATDGRNMVMRGLMLATPNGHPDPLRVAALKDQVVRELDTLPVNPK